MNKDRYDDIFNTVNNSLKLMSGSGETEDIENIWRELYRRVSSQYTLSYTSDEIEKLLMDSQQKRDDTSKQMSQLYQIFTDTNKTINKFSENISKSLQTYQKTVIQSYQGAAIRELAQLHRQMTQTNLPGMKPFCDRIRDILTILGAEEIRVKTGEQFNLCFHQKQDLSESGILIRNCLNIGWTIDDEVIVKAIVNVMDKEDEEEAIAVEK